MLGPFNTVPHAVVTPNHKVIFIAFFIIVSVTVMNLCFLMVLGSPCERVDWPQQRGHDPRVENQYKLYPTYVQSHGIKINVDFIYWYMTPDKVMLTLRATNHVYSSCLSVSVTTSLCNPSVFSRNSPLETFTSGVFAAQLWAIVTLHRVPACFASSWLCFEKWEEHAASRVRSLFLPLITSIPRGLYLPWLPKIEDLNISAHESFLQFNPFFNYWLIFFVSTLQTPSVCHQSSIVFWHLSKNSEGLKDQNFPSPLFLSL